MSDFWQQKEDQTLTVGLSETAQERFGTIKFVDLPLVGTQLTKGEPFMSVEAEKVVLDLESPVDGTIVAVNEAASDDPALLNATDMHQNWIATINLA